MVNQLCIGTAQFGLNYGITNQNGIVNKNEVRKIFKIAKNNKIEFIDTAQTYNDSERVIGRIIKNNNFFKIITKLDPKLFESSKYDLYESLENSFLNSLQNLNVKSIDSLLLHDHKNLRKFDNQIIFDWVETLKERKLINRFGLSIYSPDDLLDINIKKLDLIQLPFSIYDQRFKENGIIKYLADCGVSVHIRSIFLQGLLLQFTDLWPKNMSESLKNHHDRFLNEIYKNKLDLLEEIMRAPFFCEGVEAVVIGMTSSFEFEQIVSKWLKFNLNETNEIIKSKDWSWSNYSDMDPREWN